MEVTLPPAWGERERGLEPGGQVEDASMQEACWGVGRLPLPG